MEFDPISLFSLESNLPNVIAGRRKLNFEPSESLLFDFRKSKLIAIVLFTAESIYSFRFKLTQRTELKVPAIQRSKRGVVLNSIQPPFLIVEARGFESVPWVSLNRKEYIHMFNFKPSKEERQFLPALKDWVSLPSNG